MGGANYYSGGVSHRDRDCPYYNRQNMAAPTHGTATDSSVSVEQEVFTQRKLKDLYQKTCERLRRYRSWIEFAQEVLVWRKPAASLTLYVIIHGVFMYVCSIRLRGPV